MTRTTSPSPAPGTDQPVRTRTSQWTDRTEQPAVCESEWVCQLVPVITELRLRHTVIRLQQLVVSQRVMCS